VRCLANELYADFNQAQNEGCTPLYLAARRGRLPIVQYLVKECGTNINQARPNGITPLMTASAHKHTEVVVWLIKHGADAQAYHQQTGSAADISTKIGAPSEQTEYLEARTDCANPGCTGAGLKKCAAARLPEGVLLWACVHSGAQAGAQGRMQAVGR
jgi:hypothetical protein